MMDVDVECYSGSRYAEKPLAFYFEGNKHRVAAVISEITQENGRVFMVRTEDDLLFQLLYDTAGDYWQVTSL